MTKKYVINFEIKNGNDWESVYVETNNLEAIEWIKDQIENEAEKYNTFCEITEVMESK